MKQKDSFLIFNEHVYKWIFLRKFAIKCKASFFMKIAYIRKLQYDPDDIDVRLQYFKLGYIIHMIEKKKLTIYDDDLQYMPAAWTRKQKSLFIESLLIKLPIPLFYFDGSNYCWKVIDGLQRLSAVNEFMQGEFKLVSLEYLKEECEGLSYSDLPGYLRARLSEAEIVAYVINPGTPHSVKYNIFKRINETAVHLNGQEIRQVFFHGQAGSFLKKLAELPIFRELSREHVTRRRMKDREFINRFIAFFYLLDDYDGDMDAFLYKGMDVLDAFEEKQLAFVTQIFVKGIERSAKLFGEYLFRKPLTDETWSKTWNKAIYDTCMYNLARIDEEKMRILLNNKRAFLDEFIVSFTKGGALYPSITNAPDSRKSVMVRINGLKDLMTKYIEL